MRTLFCYGPQAGAVKAILHSMGVSARISPVMLGHELRGMERATFVRVTNHPVQPPEEFDQVLRINGLMTMDLSDEYLRQRLGGRRQAS